MSYLRHKYYFGGIQGVLYETMRFAVSVRRLNPSYLGNCMTVRRSSDNSTLDIGFVSSELDATSLIAFVGNNIGYVTKWNDQSGNGFDMTQTNTSYQPIIAQGGAIITNYGKPSILSENKYMTNSLANFRLTQTTMFAKFSTTDLLTDNNFPKGVIGIGNTGTSDYASNKSKLINLSRNVVAGTDAYITGYNPQGNTSIESSYYFLNVNDSSTNANMVICEAKNGVNNSKLLVNNVIKSVDTNYVEFLETSENGIILGSRYYAPTTYPCKAKMQEFVIFNSYKSDYQNYNQDIMSYYGI